MSETESIALSRRHFAGLAAGSALLAPNLLFAEPIPPSSEPDFPALEAGAKSPRQNRTPGINGSIELESPVLVGIDRNRSRSVRPAGPV